MTISAHIRKRLRRYALFCLVAATSAGAAPSDHPAYGGNTHDSTHLCGWVELSPKSEAKAAATSPHESSAESKTEPATEADAEPASKKPASRTASDFNRTVAAVAAAASAGTPVALSQWTEPFAMVGPDGSRTPAEIVELQKWIASAQQFVHRFGAEARGGFVPIVDFDGQLDCPAATPAADSELLLVETTAPPQQSSAAEAVADVSQDSQAAECSEWSGCGEWYDCGELDVCGELAVAEEADRKDGGLVGSSAVIATIDEPYLPYDLADRDRDDVDDAAAEQAEPASPEPSSDQLVRASESIAADESATAPATDSQPAIAEPADESEADSQPGLIVWADGLFESRQQPFCIRSLLETRQPGWSPLAMKGQRPTQRVPVPLSTAEPSEAAEADNESPAIDAVVAVESSGVGADPEVGSEPEAVAAPEAEVNDAAQAVAEDEAVAAVTAERQERRIETAHCLMDEWVWQVGNAMEDQRLTDRWLRPAGYGQRIARLVAGGDRLASRLAKGLATVWPAPVKGDQAVPGGGARLLARAEAATQPVAEHPVHKDSADSLTPEQLAQARATLRQWVDVAQSVIDDVSKRLVDVTEVARIRGTQDDSTRR